jgi:quercetin dioxygenase-like cupin family protein
MVSRYGGQARSACHLANNATTGDAGRHGRDAYRRGCPRPDSEPSRGTGLDTRRSRAPLHIGASTISRIETGHRRLAIDHLSALARALETTIDELLVDDSDGDVVIRPTRSNAGNGAVTWPLTRHHDAAGRVVAKMRIPASKRRPDPQIHPGREWFYVLAGTARLLLGEREHLVHAGEAAEFNTMTPHWIAGYGGPVEILTLFDRDGELAHLRPRGVERAAARRRSV